ncbi:MAG: DoxX family protein [Kiritimatiellales bacterium]|nr:DoxX family protein [Kiritimatiellales bacterium]
MFFQRLDEYRDAGLLVLRIGIGIMFMLHGYPKLTGGAETWHALGGALSGVGVTVAPTFLGFMAAISEFCGGLLLVAGLLTRPACFFLLSTMAVAITMHLSNGDPFRIYSHALEAGILFFSLLLIGPGKYSLDEKLFKRKDYSNVWKPSLKLFK